MGRVNMSVIRNDADVATGAQWLASVEPAFGRVMPLIAPLPLRLGPDGFGALLHIILGQQVSVASANAVWRKLQDAGLDTRDTIANADQDDLRSYGLTRQKARYANALAVSDVDFDALHDMSNDQAIKTLRTVPGIGTWTAEVYAMFAMGRADVFAPGDLAIQEAAKVMFKLPARPNEKDMRAMSVAWSPWRSVAARIFWAYYAYIKKKDGII